MRKLIVLMICPWLILAVNGQSDSLKVRKNSIFGSAGFIPGPFGGIGTVGSFNYERLAIKGWKSNYYFRASIASYGDEDFRIPISTLGFTMLTGKQKSHFEMGLGIALSVDNKKIVSLPAVNIGYRYQPPDERFLIRSGAGFPDLIFIGLGYQF